MGLDLKKEINSKIRILYSTINNKEKIANYSNNNTISQKDKISTLIKDKNNYIKAQKLQNIKQYFL